MESRTAEKPVFKKSAKASKELAGKDRRKEDRLQEENKVVFSLEPSSGNSEQPESYCALTFDLSPGGARIITHIPVLPGGLMWMELGLSQVHKLIHITGTVLWVRQLFNVALYEAGIEFTKISSKDRMLLLNYIYKRDLEL